MKNLQELLDEGRITEILVEDWPEKIDPGDVIDFRNYGEWEAIKVTRGTDINEVTFKRRIVYR